MRAAVIDIGSNSTKLIIGEKSGEEFKILESLKNIIGFGISTFYQGRITQDIVNQSIHVLNQYKKVISDYRVTDIKVIATTAVREAENKDIFLDTIRRRTGLDIEVLNVGDVVYYIDAYLSYRLKKSYPINEKNLIIAELGAGSLDLSMLEKGFALVTQGLPIGTLRLKKFKNRIDGSQKQTYEALEEYVEHELLNIKKFFFHIHIDDVILVDESYSVALHNILSHKKLGSNFFQLQFRESKEFLSLVTSGNLDDLAQKYNISTDTASSLDGYAVILHKLFKLTSKRSIYILETSLSEALLAHTILGLELDQKYHRENQLVSVAKFLCRKYNSDLKHAKYISYLSEEIFNHVGAALGLEDRHLLYLRLAAYLHEIGMLINPRGHHKHSEYIINALSLFRLTAHEIKCIACVARYHRGAVPQKTHVLYGSLPNEEQLVVQKLSSIIRLANALDGSEKQKIKKVDFKRNAKGDITLIAYTNEGMTLENVYFNERKRLFEELSGNDIKLVIRKPV